MYRLFYFDIIFNTILDCEWNEKFYNYHFFLGVVIIHHSSPFDEKKTSYGITKIFTRNLVECIQSKCFTKLIKITKSVSYIVVKNS